MKAVDKHIPGMLEGEAFGLRVLYRNRAGFPPSHRGSLMDFIYNLHNLLMISSKQGDML
jgi:hypothetical protein